MPISDHITILDTDLRPGNPYSETLKLQWINEVEGSIWYQIYKYKTSASIMRQVNVASYSLPVGVTFDKITDVYIDGTPIPRIEANQKDTTGYYRGTDGKINIYPVPTASDSVAGLVVGHVVPFTKHTATNEALFAESPFDRMYYEYLCAKVDQFLKNYTDYNNSLDLFNETFKEYAAWWSENNTTEGTV